MTDFQKLTNFQNLYNSYLAAKRGKSKRPVVRFEYNALENLYVLRRQLLDRSYRVSEYSEFEVSEPKRRVIKSGAFRDKVLQHCLCDYVLLPKMAEIFVRDSAAGQKNKGTLFALDRLREQLLEFYAEHGIDGFILKCDIKKFFYSIDHDTMKKCIRKYMDDPDIIWICDELIDSTDNPGLPLGNQSSQVFALMYLNEMDHMITEEFGCQWYGRYMDDFYLVSERKDFLMLCKEQVAEHLESLKLSLNSKTEIVPISKGIRFLGFHTYLTSDGVVIRKLTGEKKRSIKKRIRKKIGLVKAGKLSLEDFTEWYNSWKNHVSHGNCIKLSYSMDQFVAELLKEGGDECTN